LRQLARRRLTGEAVAPTDDELDTRQERVVHELAVHQIELEMQNEELQQAQLALEATGDRYADLYEKAPVGYVTLTPLGAIVAANRMAVEMLGAREPQLVGRSFESFVALEDQEAFLRHRKTVLSGKGATKPLDVRLEVPQMPLRWVRLDMVAVHARESASEWLVAMTDITDRVRLQHDLSRLAAVVASSEDAIVSLDIEGRVTSWNDAATRLFGPSADAMLGKTLDALVPPTSGWRRSKSACTG
jgi:PAS domain S-box-containing protein